MNDRILCGCGCDASIKKLNPWKVLGASLIGGIMLIGAVALLSGCTSDEEKAKHVQVQAKAEAQRIAKAEQCAEAKTRVLAEGFLIMDQVNTFPDEDRLKRWQASTLDCP
jgi:hypothetical protein